MKTFLLGLLVVASAAFANADEAKIAFDAGKYGDAAQQLERQVSSTPPNAAGFSNLGNAYEKAGQPVKAILNYERALLLDPGLKPARNALAARAAAQGISLPSRSWVDDVNAVVHPDTLVCVGTGLAWLGAIGFVLAVGSSRRLFGQKALAIVVLVGGGILVAAGCWTDPRMAGGRPAIIAAEKGADVLTAPANNSTAIVALPAGTAVRVLSPRGAWTYVGVAGGAKGWVQSDQLASIVPGEIF